MTLIPSESYRSTRPCATCYFWLVRASRSCSHAECAIFKPAFQARYDEHASYPERIWGTDPIITAVCMKYPCSQHLTTDEFYKVTEEK